MSHPKRRLGVSVFSVQGRVALLLWACGSTGHHGRSTWQRRQPGGEEEAGPSAPLRRQPGVGVATAAQRCPCCPPPEPPLMDPAPLVGPCDVPARELLLHLKLCSGRRSHGPPHFPPVSSTDLRLSQAGLSSQTQPDSPGPALRECQRSSPRHTVSGGWVTGTEGALRPRPGCLTSPCQCPLCGPGKVARPL